MKLLAKMGLLVLVLLLLGVTAVCAEPAVKVYLKFDEGQGSVAKDSSGLGNDGKLVNNPQWVDGKFGKALYFSKTDADFSNVELPIGPNDVGKAGTIMFWFKPDWDGAGMHTLLEATRTETNRAFFIAYGEEDQFLEFTFEDSTDGDWEAEAVDHVAEIESGKWYFIAAVWDCTDSSSFTARLYVNGEKWGEASSFGAEMGVFENFTVGSQRYDYWASGSADGVIDELKIISGALTDAQILEAYNQSK